MTPETFNLVMVLLAAAACGYAAASYFFLRHPNYLHRRRERRFPECVHISHRGGAGEAYENTVPAFARAVRETGTDMLELDVHLTKDGRVVVLHDCNLKRATGVDAEVTETDYADLPPLLEEITIDFDPGKRFRNSNTSHELRRIATLEEVFESFPTTAVNIDVKDHDPNLARAVSQLIVKYDRANLTVWGNARAETVQMCHQINPDVGILFSLRRVLQVLALYYAGLLPFVPLWETHFEIPLISVFHQEERGFWFNTAVYLLDKILMRRSLFEHLRYRGIPVYAWVLNTEEDFDKAFACGVSGIMTDYPAKLRRYLKDRPELLNEKVPTWY